MNVSEAEERLRFNSCILLLGRKPKPFCAGNVSKLLLYTLLSERFHLPRGLTVNVSSLQVLALVLQLLAARQADGHLQATPLVEVRSERHCEIRYARHSEHIIGMRDAVGELGACTHQSSAHAARTLAQAS